MYRKLRFLPLITLFMMLFAFTVTSYAVKVEKSAHTERTVVITWSENGGADEYRICSGDAGVEGWSSSTPAGSGDSASYEVSTNGVYTVYAKTGDTISFKTVTVKEIDDDIPDIEITEMSPNGDGTYEISFKVHDNFANCETRILDYNAGIDQFDAGKKVTGLVIHSLKPGTYTLLSKDDAGHVGIYTLSLDGNEIAKSAEEGETWKTSESESYEFSDAKMWAKTVSEERETNPADSYLVVIKVDKATGKPLSGAKMRVYNADTKEVFDEWVTDGKDHTIYNIPADIRVTIEEIEAPSGYGLADPKTVTTKAYTYQNIIVKDEKAPTTETTPEKPGDSSDPYFLISKTDAATSKELPGAQLVVKDANGNTVESWVSGTTPRQIRIADGTYTLTEITAPDGYAVAETITFEVKNGTVAGGKVTMKDAPKGGMETLPQTGGNDDRMKLVLLAVCLVFIGGAGLVIYSRKTAKSSSK